MWEYALLLLPIAYAIGWYQARKKYRIKRDQPPLSNDYFRGLNFLLNEQQDKAIEVFIDMLDVNNDTVETHLVLGSLFRKRGEVDRAIRVHQNLIARPNLETVQKSNALLELARDYMSAGLLDRAEGVFQDLIKHGQFVEEAGQLLQRLYELEKEWGQAILVADNQERQIRLRLKPVVAQYHCELAEEALQRGERRLAERHIKGALSQESSNARAHLLAGQVAMDEEDYKAAIKSFTAAVKDQLYWFPLISESLKEAYCRLGRQNEWSSWLGKLLEFSEDAYVRLAYLGSLLEFGRAEEARQSLDKQLSRGAVTLEELDVYLQYHALNQPNGSDLVAHLRQWVQARMQAEPGFSCDVCGYQARVMVWQCPSCHKWGSVKPRKLSDETTAFDAKTITVPKSRNPMPYEIR